MLKRERKHILLKTSLCLLKKAYILLICRFPGPNIPHTRIQSAETDQDEAEQIHKVSFKFHLLMLVSVKMLC